MLTAQNLLVDGTNDGALIAIGGLLPVFFVLTVCKPLDTQSGRHDKRHVDRADYGRSA